MIDPADLDLFVQVDTPGDALVTLQRSIAPEADRSGPALAKSITPADPSGAPRPESARA